jgi:cytochrome c-type biogenesis protein
MSFAVGWTPCVGPILAAILGLAGTSGDAGKGALLLLAYSLGLGVPFLAVALLFERTKPLMRWLNRHSLIINRVAGVVLVIVGLLIFSGRLASLATWLARVLPTFSV